MAKTSLRRMPHVANDQAQDAARFGGQLPPPQPTFVFFFHPGDDGADAGGPHGLIASPTGLVEPRRTDHEQPAPFEIVHHRQRAKPARPIDHDDRPTVGGGFAGRGKGERRGPGPQRLGEPFDDRAAAKTLLAQQRIQSRSPGANDSPRARQRFDGATQLLAKFGNANRHESPEDERSASIVNKYILFIRFAERKGKADGKAGSRHFARFSNKK